MAATEKVIEDEYIGVGNEVFLTGLFTEHTGENKNLPIVRTGNIALMPEERVRVVIDRKEVMIDAFLIEARSIGGLSGSPVFVYLGPIRSSKRKSEEPLQDFYWLGLMHGHWDIGAKTDEAEQDNTEVPVEEKVNMGIAIVVPTTKILEVINQPNFADKRDKANEEARKKHLPTTDIADDEEENNNEAEFTESDFENALLKVSRRDESESKKKSKKRRKTAD